MQPQPITLEFPLGGVSKRFGFTNQKPQTTPSALNVWPIEWTTGRARGAVRPGLTSSGGAPSGTPLNWCYASWTDGFGVGVTTTAGTYTTTDGATWTSRIGAPSSSSFASCITFNGVLYQADFAGAVKRYNLSAGTSGTLAADVAADKLANESNQTPTESIPTHCWLVYLHAGKLLFAGFASDYHLLVASRTGNPNDYDFSKTDPGAAWTSAGIAGNIRNPITSLFGHGNGCLAIGSPDSIDFIRGDLLVGSTTIEEVSTEVGPLMQSAICKTDSDHTVFMSRLGLYAINPGCGSAPECLTDEIPNDLMGVNPASGDTCAVGYDGRYGGVHVYVDKNSGTDAHYFFHFKTRTWWPMSFAGGTLKLAVNLRRASSLTKSGLLALRSGSSSQFDTGSTESISSSVWYGPLLSPTGREDKLQYVDVTLAETSTQCTFNLYRGKSAQEAFNSTAYMSWTDLDDAQRNYRKWVMARGTAFYLEVVGTGTQRPCVEKIEGQLAGVSAARRSDV